ncbi:MAG: AMP-binding protein [Porticoccaceae bacterium]|jgi:long-chain acyl-CoA synthetase|nr:MAG: long-chain fatty acid--CoA ligase [SAR92 bacterium BACL16 MAG-120619-bin48]MDP4654047.1 AMP-binding protein [Alphaproteobacteria bacterium]MDP4745283.1 AMP-binding protein [Porticoccaceae bacterium]MDP4751964.1 AMP-binding protein [Porticoccaceae bacterium]MDP4890959.1 AMP-binding protein [Porticoccaceae bacterium]
MQVQDAVKKAQQRMGLTSEQPPLPAQSLLQLWQQAVADSADSPAFTCLGKTLTYGDVDKLADRAASYFYHEMNLRAGDRLAVQLPNLLQYPVVVVAAWKVGLVIVNTNPMYTHRELVHQFNDSGATVVVVLDQFYETLRAALPETGVKHVIVTRPIDLLPQPKKLLLAGVMKVLGKRPALPASEVIHFSQLLAAQGDAPAHSPALADICALQYTGGTTGVSKGVMLTQQSILSNIAQALEIVAIGGHSIKHFTTVSPLPLYHIYAYMLNMGLMPATRGHSLLIPDPRNIPAFVKTIKNVKFEIFCGLNSLFVGLLQNKEFQKMDFSSLSLTLSGGMALMDAVAHDWERVTGCVVSEGYGMTESSPIISMNPSGFQKIGTAGIPIPGTEIKVVDEHGVEQEVGGVGELCVRGAQVMRGYWQREAQTAEVIVDGWLHTGDIVTVDEEGYVKIVDRLKDMIIVSGFNVYPSELEQTLTLHPAVLECAAIGVADNKAGEVVKMFVVASDPNLTQEQVIEYCRANMAGYKVPKFVEFRNDLPKSNVGKVLRKELKAEELAKAH